MPAYAPILADGPATADDTANDTAIDVIGNKEDVADETVDTASHVALLRAAIAKLNGGTVLTFPVASAGVQLTAGAANTYGAAADVVVTADLVAAGFAGDVRLESLSLRTPSAAMLGKVQIGHQTGAGAITYICEVDIPEVASDAGALPRIDLNGRGGLIPLGADIVARHKSVAGATTIDVSVGVMDAI